MSVFLGATVLALSSVEASGLLQYGFINHDLVTGYTFELYQHPQAVIPDVSINKENAVGNGFKEVYVPILREEFGLTFE